MTSNPINFKRERDFGDLFNATFSFISQEFRQLATAILYFVSPFLLLSGISITVYSIKSQEIMQASAASGKSDPFAVFSMLGSVFGYLGLAMAISIISSAMLIATVYAYIKLYIQNGSGGFTLNDIWGQIRKYFLNSLLSTFLVGLVVVLGFVMCVLPGIYLGVALSIVFCIIIFEDKNFGEAFSRSISLINKNWWQTFAVVIITTIILYVLMILVSIPNFIFGFKSFFTNIKSGHQMSFDLPVSYYVINAITQVLTQLLMVIPLVICAFIYYSVVEKVEKPSLMEKISQMNENEAHN